MSSADAYEAHALEFLHERDRSCVGADLVARWARELTGGTEVIEIACGGGYPVTRSLVQSGLKIWAIDSSPSLLAQFQSRFPDVPTQCALALESDYFGRKFGAAISIGLLFLLRESDQIALLDRVSQILLPGGRFLFTAPIETGSWRDRSTGHECRSLGRTRYVQALQASGFRLVATYADEGENNHYDAEKVAM